MLAHIIATLIAVLVVPALRAEPATAIVAALSGDATRTDSKGHSQPLHLFDWLGPETTVESARGGHLVIAFANGKRFELTGAAKMTVGEDGPKDATGTVRALPALPPLPQLAPIANQAHASARSGAIRVRSGQGAIQGLYPRDGFSALPDETVLRFTASADAASYKIELEDDTGRVIFQIQTSSIEVAVPPGTLQAGARYYWRVRGFGVLGTSVRGETEFTTLGADDISRRATFREALGGGDADALTTLAAVDMRLGLLSDAREELRMAVAQSAQPAAIREELAAVDRQVEGLESTTK